MALAAWRLLCCRRASSGFQRIETAVFCQVAHLVGHYGKAAPCSSPARAAIDRRVQRQQVGLFGDGADHFSTRPICWDCSARTCTSTRCPRCAWPGGRFPRHSGFPRRGPRPPWSSPPRPPRPAGHARRHHRWRSFHALDICRKRCAGPLAHGCPPGCRQSPPLAPSEPSPPSPPAGRWRAGSTGQTWLPPVAVSSSSGRVPRPPRPVAASIGLARQVEDRALQRHVEGHAAGSPPAAWGTTYTPRLLLGRRFQVVGGNRPAASTIGSQSR